MADNDRRTPLVPPIAGIDSPRGPRQRVWQQAFADYVPVILFAMAWAVIRVPRAAHTPQNDARQ